MRKDKWAHSGAAVVATLLAACTANQGFRIEGSLDGGENKLFGDTVFLARRADGVMQRTDSTLVGADGTFRFEGEPDSTARFFIQTYDNEGKSWDSQEIFLEKGVITYRQNASGTHTGGTPLNEAYTQCSQRIEAVNKELKQVGEEAARNAGDNGVDTEKYQIKMQELEGVIIDCLEANAQTPVVTALLVDHQMELMFCSDMARFAAILDRITEPMASQPVVGFMKGMAATMIKTAPGKAYTDFELADPQGKPMKLSDYVGRHKAVLVDFWASWCGPCRASMPALKEIYAQYHSKGFEVVGVSLDSSADKWKEAIEGEALPWPQMSDLKGWNCQGAGLYGVRMIPATVLIDAQGTIVARNINEDALRKKLDEILK